MNALPPADGRLHKPLAAGAHGLAGLALLMIVAGLPEAYELTTTVDSGVTPAEGLALELWLLTPDDAAALAGWGVSPAAYALDRIAVQLLIMLIFWGVAAVILPRRYAQAKTLGSPHAVRNHDILVGGGKNDQLLGR